jgi:hypothetical protein
MDARLHVRHLAYRPPKDGFRLEICPRLDMSSTAPDVGQGKKDAAVSTEHHKVSILNARGLVRGVLVCNAGVVPMNE